MIIDFRVRAPFAAYASSPLFTRADMVEQDTMTRTDTPMSPSAKQFSLDLLMREAEEAGVDRMVVPCAGPPEDAMRILPPCLRPILTS